MFSRPSGAFLQSMIRLLRAPSWRRAAFGVTLALLAAALHFAWPPVRMEPLPSAGLGPFIAIAALLGRRAGGLAALFVATALVMLFDDPDPEPFRLVVYVAKWLAVVLVADVAHNLWLRAAENERVRAEEARLAQQRLELALESGAIGTFEVDLSTHHMRLNEKHREIFGWSNDQLVTTGLIDTLVVPEDLPGLQEARARTLSGKERFHAKIRIRRANDGALRHVETRGEAVFENGVPVRVFGATRDVTDEREAAASLEERARLSEQNRSKADELVQAQKGLALALEAGAIGVGELDLRSGVVKVNDKLRKIYGLGAGPVMLDSLDGLVVAEDRTAYYATIAQALDPRGAGQCEQRFRIRRRDDDAVRWVYTRSQVFFEDGAAVRVVGLMRDITDERAAAAMLEEKARLAQLDRVRAEELARERRRLELALEAGAIGTFEVDLIRGDIHLSEKHREISGWTSEEPLPVDIMDGDMVVEEDRAVLQEARLAALRGDGRYAAQFRIRRANDGALRWVDTRGQVYFEGDAPARVFGVTRDITDERAAAAVLQERARLAEQLSALAEALPGAIYSYVGGAVGRSQRGFVAYVSSNIERLLGFAPAVFARDIDSFLARVHPDDLPRVRAAAKISARDLALWNVVFRYDHPERGEIWIEGDSQPTRREDGATVWHGYYQDVTERETAARALADSEARVRALKDERLAALEKLAARLAHEVNQPLAAAATLLAVARRRLTPNLPDDDSRAAGAEALKKAAHQLLRAGQIITRVREFTQHGEADKVFRSVHETIHETLAQLEGDLSFSGFAFELRLEAARDRVLIDRLQIAAVLTNLLRNAAQAALPGGRRAIVVATRNQWDRIEISIIDYGAGVSEDARRHLFDLFWTTKGSGMGVGLAMSKAIVEAHYGTIWLQDDAEKTVFTFSLPLMIAGDDPRETR
ncbi:PAS domain S-box-containing protein [Rhodoblastus acidophilus]|uniref:PAS domain-containing sensor histidine kinase n=1 Tax=Rhodoblastus acidophilus TaxID=1074 RepID=UPI002224FDAE|nr:PAS domain-containing protein [Rhodoblastus acidophilus]MCW2286582.1 PAS domain S-box-containing protein [Rhodoblastus acidophilus]MCW2335448.1 PAS domain S-box-containing protein [Rhodoblastus acidophilus]